MSSLTRWVLAHKKTVVVAWIALAIAGMILSVILVGAFILGPSVEQLRDGSGGVEGGILAGAVWDLLALGTATALPVFQPGKARQTSRRRKPAL